MFVILSLLSFSKSISDFDLNFLPLPVYPCVILTIGLSSSSLDFVISVVDCTEGRRYLLLGPELSAMALMVVLGDSVVRLRLRDIVFLDTSSLIGLFVDETYLFIPLRLLLDLDLLTVVSLGLMNVSSDVGGFSSWSCSVIRLLTERRLPVSVLDFNRPLPTRNELDRVEFRDVILTFDLE